MIDIHIEIKQAKSGPVGIGLEVSENLATNGEILHGIALAQYVREALTKYSDMLVEAARTNNDNEKVVVYDGEAAGRMMRRLHDGA